MAFKEVYDCEILISEIERRPALYDFSLKEYVIRVWKRDCGEKCARAKMEILGIMRKAPPPQNGVLATVCAVFYRNDFFYHRHVIIISNTKTHQQCQIFQIKEL